MADNILLVLGITEGRQFPKRAHHQLVVEANFDAELLCTDMIKHKDCPKFNTELAWEIDKKTLHQHRLQRTPLKVQVFTIEDSTMKKELIGYCLLDLRSATGDNEKKKLTWHSLLGSKYQKSKPEIQVSLSTESDKVRSNEIVPKEVEEIPQESSPLDVVLDDERGYYLIGPESELFEIFKLSISIGGARNLANMLPSDESIKTEDGFYFYYSLMDNDVTNETFYDLMSTRMPTERATVRIFTTPLRLEQYLRKVSSIVVYLCSNATTLGQATVSLLPLLSSPLGNQEKKVEGLFPLISPSTTNEETNALVGISVVLSKEELESGIPNSHAPNSNFCLDISGSPEHEMNASPPLQAPSKKSTEKAKRSLKNLSPVLVSPVLEDKSSHHIIFSIDIRSIANMDIQQPVYCLCRYTYPFFGSSAPILTNPAVLVQRNSEVLFPQSFCKFEFASTLNLLQTKLTCEPLIVEIWTKDVNVKDQLFGVAQVNLSSVFAPNWKDSQGKPNVKSTKVPVFNANDKPSKKVATIHVVLSLEDKGEVSKELPICQVRGSEQDPDQQKSSVLNSIDIPSESSSTTVVGNEGGTQVPARETQEYQVAMALEMWRQQQEDHFNAELTSKENQHMKVIAEEWKQRDLEREILVKRKLEEYQALEIKLKKTLEELDGREKKVLEFDDQLQRKEKLLAEEYNRRGVELTENLRRMKEEFEHQLLLERRKCADAETRSRQLEGEQVVLQQQLKEKDQELFALKESLVNRSEVKMQSDMNLLLLEKTELERKVESITKSKVHYKQQWGRALRELARVKLNEQEAAQSRLKKQQDELNHMKMRYMAEEEKKVMNTEKENFKEVKEEITKKLEQLQSSVEGKEKTRKDLESTEGVEESVNKARIAKLIEERDVLLQTGVYTLDDRVISQLDDEIQQLIHVDA